MKRKKIIILFILGFLLFGSDCLAQIVNVESKRITSDTAGWYGNVGGNFSVIRNTKTILNMEGYTTIQWKRPHNLYLFLGDYSFLKGADKNLINKSLVHFRYNHKFTPVTFFEAFTQFQNNEITRIDKRALWGAGLRFRIRRHNKKLWMYMGLAVMYEYEEVALKPKAYIRCFRNSSYLSLIWKPDSILTIISTTFFQPILDAPSNFRVLNQETVDMAITKKLSLTLSWDFLYDKTPAEGVPNLNYEFKTGLKFDFNP